MEETRDIISLIRYCLSGDTPALSEDPLSAGSVETILRVSKRHDLRHMTGWALKQLSVPLPEPAVQSVDADIFAATSRYAGLKHDITGICGLLENAQIDHLPLKGAVVRDLYPQKWMRTSSDIDILIRKADLSRATDILLENGYRKTGNNYHDIAFLSPGGNRLELHFNIREDMPDMDAVLDTVWEHTVAVSGTRYRYEMTREFLVFHTVAHMAYHFVHGGCGIRPFLDLFLIRQKLPGDEAQIAQLLARAGLTDFYSGALALIGVWFEDAPHTELTRCMEEYILYGGVFGNPDNEAVVRQGQAKSKLHLYIRRIFPPLSHMRKKYPILQSVPILLPVFWLRRIAESLLPENRARNAREWQVVRETEPAAAAEFANMMRSLNLT